MISLFVRCVRDSRFLLFLSFLLVLCFPLAFVVICLFLVSGSACSSPHCFLCLFGWLVDCLPACLVVCLLVRLFVCLFVCLCVDLFVLSFVRSFLCLHRTQVRCLVGGDRAQTPDFKQNNTNRRHKLPFFSVFCISFSQIMLVLQFVHLFVENFVNF